MKLTVRIPVTAGLLALMLCSATGCTRLRAADQLNKGVAAFKNAKYEDAENYFQKAIEIDPSYDNARIYLATTYSSQITPNLDTPDNNKIAKKALDLFQSVLQKDPSNILAMKQIASIERNTGHLKEAKDYEKKVIALAPNEAEAYYTIGVVDWMEAYKNATAQLGADKLTDDGNGNVKLPKPSCATLVAENTPLVNEGMQYLQKAVEINPNYEEAFTYLNLTERRKADLECGNAPAVKADLEQADQFSAKAMNARKVNEAKKEAKLGGGVQQ